MKRGFTLIELLIVIAIIAILALIAVPNFLEAQTRAKVSRACADMRTVATALEAYAVDFGAYPYCPRQYQYVEERDPAPSLINCMRVLTTPVAYTAQIPFDNFIEVAGFTNVVNGVATVQSNSRRPYNYFVSFIDNAGAEVTNANERRTYERGFKWILYSFGPARSSVNPADPTTGAGIYGITGGSQTYVYDPTNGTLSFGYIVNTSQGFIGPGGIKPGIK